MLRRLLDSASGKGSESVDALSRELGVSSNLTLIMLDELCRLGYLRAVVPGCTVACEACTLHPDCLIQNQPRIWTLTEAGERYLQGASSGG